MDRRLVNLFLIVLVIFVGALGFNEIQRSQFVGTTEKQTASIQVSGEGEVSAKPDLATVDLTVKNEAEEVGQAQQQNTEKVNAVTQFLKDQGVKEKDIKTSNYSLRPRYEFRETSGGAEVLRKREGKRVLVGYEVTNTLEVKIRNLDKVGEIVDGAVNAGANQVSSLRFTVENDQKVLREARQQAIKEAKSKARRLASDLGVSLVRIVNFSESGSDRPILHAERAAMDAAAGDARATPEIQPGQNELKVNVNLTYEIK